MVEKEEGEAVKRRWEVGGGGKVALGLGTAVVAGKSSEAARGKTGEGGSGERGSGEAEEGRRFWRAGRCTGDGETGAGGETGSCWGECLVEMDRPLGEAGNTVGTAW